MRACTRHQQQIDAGTGIVPRPFEKPHFGTDLHAELHARAPCHCEILRAAVIPAMLEISRLVGQVIFLVPRGGVAIRRFPDIGLVAPAPILTDHRSRSDNGADTKVAQTGDPRLMLGNGVLPGLWVGHGIGGQPWRETHFGKKQKIAAMFHQMLGQPVQRLIQRVFSRVELANRDFIEKWSLREKLAG